MVGMVGNALAPYHGGYEGMLWLPAEHKWARRALRARRPAEKLGNSYLLCWAALLKAGQPHTKEPPR